MKSVIDELVEWSIYMVTHKKGELSELNKLQVLKINRANEYVDVSRIKNSVKFNEKSVRQLTLFDFI
ncbi:hypothetical protein ACHLNJ_10645 [Staphylococcus aureus]|uniref:hypothetical protein n=1 Tax=Staphylococcus aureus TaxID=1280 RepID=UPI001249CA91|nr:hypothetical protein [Staphylococcus aureus]MDI1879974.1 hypothetical protein [Staphylococcus aureus]QPV65691.1 hypothetical protein I1A60_09465 [Staphylococcus aureus]HDA5243586.1 hypothetical protein [Staphylococcus aureus]HDA5634120.1 hypothetical protein [Staphylococcus aureus]HDA5724749.1 hypothetical protein [Staphylococcus aureus]